jgi:hypothetical protein
VKHIILLDHTGVLLEGRNPRFCPDAQRRRPSFTVTSSCQTDINVDKNLNSAVTRPNDGPSTSQITNQEETITNADVSEPSSSSSQPARNQTARPNTIRTEGFKRPNIKKTQRRKVNLGIESYTTTNGASTSRSPDPLQRKRTAPRKPDKKNPSSSNQPQFVANQT